MTEWGSIFGQEDQTSDQFMVMKISLCSGGSVFWLEADSDRFYEDSIDKNLQTHISIPLYDVRDW